MAGLAAAMALHAAPALAQTAADDEADKSAIVVTGFRASLESAVANKKALDQVIESISAEDIGKLPDASIAESIARLPGITSQRLSGRSNVISIRGFAPDFSTTLLNGREQTSTGDNRAVEYDQYPSEVINQVLIYKSPNASLVGQGLSGTVDLRTIRPLDFGARLISIGGRGAYTDAGKLNVGSREFGYRANAVYVDQFLNDSIGVALSASYTDEPYQTREFNAWGYNQAPNGAAIIGGSKSYNSSETLKRLGLQGTLQWRMSDNFTSTFDGFYSDFKEDQIKRGVELPLGFDYKNADPFTAANAPGAYTLIGQDTTAGNLVTAGTFNSVKGVLRNDAFQRHAKLYSFGYNGRYNGDDGWNAYIDISYSKTDRNELVAETYSGTGRGFNSVNGALVSSNGATDTIGFASGPRGTTFTHALNYGDYNTILLTSPQGWGGTQIAVNGTAVRGGQDGYYNNRIIRDEIWQYRAEVQKELENSFLRSVQFGLNFTDHSKSLVPDEFFLGLKANTDGTVSIPIPAQYRLGTTNSAFGLGPLVSYNPLALIKGGIYNLVPNPYGDVVVKSYSISEKLMTGYIQANLETDIGRAKLTGNVGGQVILTDQNSTGATAVFLGTNPNGSPNIGAAVRRSSVDYVDFLPSANLSLRLPSDTVVRLAASREIIRPRLDDMRASVSYSYTILGNIAFVNGSSGNPDLRPWRANAVDFTVEQYFGNKGYIAAQLFYKDLKSYIYNIDQDVPITDLALANPGTGITVQPIAKVNIPVNGKGGKLYGVEIAGTIPFGSLIGALDGFGVTGSGSYTKTRIKPTPTAPSSDLPGYSRWVVNMTGFFEKWGFNARGSVRYRSSFIGEVSGFGAGRVRRRAASETIVDAQIGYDFQPGSMLSGLSVYLQGQNLTDEPFKTFNPGHPEQVIDYQTYGRRFLAGFTYKF